MSRCLARAAARRYVELARRLVELPARTWLEVDPTHLGLDVAPRLAQGLILEVCEALPPGRFLQVGAKDDGRRTRVLELVLAARENRAPVWATVQANLRSSPQIAARLADADVPVRLVKGAYAGPPTVAYPWGEQTDLAYLRVAEALAARGAQFSLATHDPVIRESCLGRWPGLPVEMLYGVRPDDRRALVTRGVDVRVYVPFGDDWFRYFVRRIGEAQRAR